MYNLTDAQSLTIFSGLAAGALVALGILGLAIIIYYIVVAWKIFEKAGVAGWKVLIPIYNVYCFCKIVGVNFWIWVIAVPFALGFILGFANNADLSNTLNEMYGAGLAIFLSYKLGKAFGKSNGFIVGLIFLSIIFESILAFGSSKYVGNK